MVKAKVAPSTTHSTSTPLRPIFSKVSSNLEESTTALKSILGVSPVPTVSARPSTRANTPRPLGFATKAHKEMSSSLVDSGFISMSENNSTITQNTSSPSNLSMFKSIMDSRKNTSLSLEQVIDKVNSRKESQGSAKARPRTARLRSFSASEISMRMYSNKSPSFADISNMYDLTSSPEVFNMSDINECGSPTIEQAILMGCEEGDQYRHMSNE